MNVFVVSTWMQHIVLVPDKHGVHFPVLVRILKFLTLPFSIHVPLIISVFMFIHVRYSRILLEEDSTVQR